MSALMYKEDFDGACDRLTRWWNGEDIGRPAVQLRSKRTEPLEDIPELPVPKAWLTGYSTSNYDYRLNAELRGCMGYLKPGRNLF